MNRLLTYLILFCISQASYSAEKPEAATVPTYRFSGDAQLLTQYLERGLSITDGNPALTASFLFNLGSQFRAGFWGTNVSNVTSSDDNLWLKVILDVRVDFSKDSIVKFYFNDDHFYKSDLRNGRSFGVTFDYKSYMSQVEWLDNYQGTGKGAFHLRAGKVFPLYKKFLPGVHLGYTAQSSEGYLNYFDLKGTANYTITSTFEFEAGITAVTNSTQFNGRGDPSIYAGVKLNY